MIKVLVFPKYNNPYQTLLYREFTRDQKFVIKYLTDETTRYDRYALMVVLPGMILWNRLLGFKIFHIHWVAFNPPTENIFLKFLGLIYTMGILLLIKILGYSLIWTIHDIVPHTPLTTNDLLITKLLCNLCHTKIVHSQKTIDDLQALHCNTQRVHIIPHGNYIDCYPNTVNKKEARDFLGLDQKNFIYLFFGELKVYKGVEELLKTFEKLSQKESNVQLVIAGKIHEPVLEKVIGQYRKVLQKKLVLFLRFIPDDEIQYFMNASDVVVYPCRKITTSGSVLLAFSFGKLVIYPLLGALIDFPTGLGIPYKATDNTGLASAMKKIIHMDAENKKRIEEESFRYASSLNWQNIAKKTMQLYEKK